VPTLHNPFRLQSQSSRFRHSQALQHSHITMTGGRGTPGYAAPELWMPFPIITPKCDVYSFSTLLFEIIGRRRNMDIKLAESQEWFPICENAGRFSGNSRTRQPV